MNMNAITIRLSTRSAADACGIPRQTLARWLDGGILGGLPATSGGATIYTIDDLTRLVCASWLKRAFGAMPSVIRSTMYALDFVLEEPSTSGWLLGGKHPAGDGVALVVTCAIGDTPNIAIPGIVDAVALDVSRLRVAVEDCVRSFTAGRLALPDAAGHVLAPLAG